MPFTPRHPRALIVDPANAAATLDAVEHVRTCAGRDPSSPLVDAFILIPAGNDSKSNCRGSWPQCCPRLNMRRGRPWATSY